MIKEYIYKNLRWVDLESPTASEVKDIMDSYAIDPMLAEDLLIPSSKPRLEIFDNYIYAVFNVPALRRSVHAKKPQEVDFIVAKNAVITARYETVDPLHNFSKVFEAQTILDKSDFGDHGGFIFYHMMKKVYEAIGDELERLSDNIFQLEEKIIAGSYQDTSIEITRIVKDLIDFKHSIAHHKDILTNFEKISGSLFGENYIPYARDLISEYMKISDITKNQIELVSELRALNTDLLNAKQNELIKTFTILAFSTFPLSLIVTVLAFNSPTNPFLAWPYNFTAVVALVLVGTLGMLTLFKFKKWL